VAATGADDGGADDDATDVELAALDILTDTDDDFGLG
jgi:hypothetical protein